MAIVVADTIDLLQALNRQADGLESAPLLINYPAALDNARLPIALTRKEAGEFRGANNENYSTDTYVIQVLFESILTGEYGYVLQKGHDLLDKFRTLYLDESQYVQLGTRVLQLSPYRIEIVFPVRDTGMTVVEWPQGHDRWWHGFELRVTIRAESWSC